MSNSIVVSEWTITAEPGDERIELCLPHVGIALMLPSAVRRLIDDLNDAILNVGCTPGD